jgi:hypothetical protein
MLLAGRISVNPNLFPAASDAAPKQADQSRLSPMRPSFLTDVGPPIYPVTAILEILQTRTPALLLAAPTIVPRGTISVSVPGCLLEPSEKRASATPVAVTYRS